MKPYLYATIIFAGAVVGLGSTAIVSSEYRLVSARAEALRSLLGNETHTTFVAMRSPDMRLDRDESTTPDRWREAVFEKPSVNLDATPVRDQSIPEQPEPARRMRTFHRAQLTSPRPTAPTPVDKDVLLTAEPVQPAHAVKPIEVRIKLPDVVAAQGNAPSGFSIKCGRNVADFKLPGKELALYRADVQKQFKEAARQLKATFVNRGDSAVTQYQIEQGVANLNAAMQQMDEAQKAETATANADVQIANDDSSTITVTDAGN